MMGSTASLVSNVLPDIVKSVHGETSHAQVIAGAVAHGLTGIAIQTGVPTVFGIVTADNLRQARVRCLGKQYNRGREAARTAIEMARLWKTL